MFVYSLAVFYDRVNLAFYFIIKYTYSISVKGDPSFEFRVWSMIMLVYLDNSATTKPCAEAVQAVAYMMEDNFGNPSSLHEAGNRAHEAVEQARGATAKALGCEKEEVTFTSGGTEANNLALFGAARAGARKGRRIVTTKLEHESVLEAAQQLEREGFEVITLTPDRLGNISPAAVFEAVNSDTILVSMMLVNNEVGSVLPVETMRKAVRRAKAPALIHCDAVQAFGKLPVKPEQMGVDLLTVTAHKIHGPKGVGALYHKKGVRILPRTFGGEQEKRLRPGTEATPLIAGFGAAVEAFPDLAEQEAAVRELNVYARERLAQLNGVQIHSARDASPFILNLSALGVRSQTMIQHLSDRFQVCVSNGSACAKGKKSHVLTAMGLAPGEIDSALRASFCKTTTKEDIDVFVRGLRDGLSAIARA